MTAKRNYWFKAKKSGLGWSSPLTWQGWVVYVVLFGSVGYFYIAGRDVGQKLLGVWIPILVALPIFWLFGEPLTGKKSSE